MKAPASPAKTVIVPLVNGFEEIETVVPVDLLRRAGAEVLLCSVDGSALHRGRCGMSLAADTALDDVADMPCDLLLIPGGPGVAALRADRRIAAMASRTHAAGAIVAAICAAPAVLGDAGLLRGRRFTAHFSVHPEFPDADGSSAVVADSRVITSRGAGTAMAFGLALVESLYGPAARRDIETQIML